MRRALAVTAGAQMIDRPGQVAVFIAKRAMPHS